MIDRMNGMLTAYEAGSAIVQVGGIDIIVLAPNIHIASGAPISLYIDWVWSADNGPQLYGFKTRAERSLFSLVRNCQGIGAKGALSLIATCGADGLARMIAERKIDELCKAPGVGRKRAELIVAQLHEKILDRLADFCSSGDTSYYRQIHQALVGLGYASTEIQRALGAIEGIPLESFEQGLKKALRALVPG